MQIRNELSWSRTRIGALETCRRQYYYQYYLKWGGWEWDAAEPRKKAYVFSKMCNLATLLGTAVHETIKIVLQDIRDTGRPQLEDPAFFARKEVLTKTWRDAEKGLWQRSAKKHPPVFELYYDQRPTPSQLKEVGERASQCIATFLASPLYAELSEESDRDWLAVDDGPDFDDSKKYKIDGRTIWALPDFARRTSDGIVEIWDWKTGLKNPNDRLQLLSYALHARDCWGIAPEDIRLFGYYLAHDEISEYSCDAEALEEMESRIRRDFDTMTALLEDTDQNIPKDAETHFPMNEDERFCGSCFYRELCER